MLIDVTRKPALILPDVLQDSVVVRSIGNQEVSGQVTFRYERRGVTKSEIITVPPGAEITRGGNTCFETRLMLPGCKRGFKDRTPFDFLDDWHDYDKPVETIHPEPYEVASAFKDSVTDFRGTWRLGVRIEKSLSNKKLWLVTVFDGMSGAPLCTVGSKDLDPRPQTLEPLPLTRATRTVTTGTAWDRILGDDD